MNRQRLIERSLGLASAVADFVARARQYFYAVVLHGHQCPACRGPLLMEGEGRCRCDSCGTVLDPTVAFQHCPTCGGVARLSIRRYACASCASEIHSRFLFDGLIFDAAYFRQKMAEHRQQQRELRGRVRELLAGTRSAPVAVPPADLAGSADLFAAIDALTARIGTELVREAGNRFDLHRYEAHVRANLRAEPLSLDEIPPLSPENRADRIWRFIAIIFLAHAGLLRVWQDGPHIMVIPRETHAEGQELPGDSPDPD